MKKRLIVVGVIIFLIVFGVIGVLLINNIFVASIELPITINDKIRYELKSDLSGNEEDCSPGTICFPTEKKIAFYEIPSDEIVKVSRGKPFGLAVGATTSSAEITAFQNLKYNLKLIAINSDSCVSKNSNFKNYIKFHNFEGEKSTDGLFDEYEDRYAFVMIVFDVPSDAAPCTQKITFTLIEDGNLSAWSTFTLQIKSFW